MRHYFILPFVIVFLFINACSNIYPTVDSSSLSTVYPESSYPGPEHGYPYPYPYSAYVSPTSSYPQPQSTELKYFATLGPVPIPGADWGVVAGRLFSNRKPVYNATLYLAELAKDDEGTETIASFSPSTSPWAYTNESGNFAFSNIQPGRYSLVLDMVIDAILLNEPGQKISLTLTVESGKVTDLGDLLYTDLPIPP